MTAPVRARSLGYRAVKADILDRIHQGDWGPGTQLPAEAEIAAGMGISRATVNRALQELAVEGIVERRRRAGTVVRRAPIRAARFSIPILRDEIAATGASYRYVLLDRSERAAPRWLRARLSLPDAAPVLRLSCLHAAGPTPYAAEERWISLGALPEARGVDFAATAPTEWLIATVPYSEVEVSLFARAADPASAAALGVPAGSALLATERTTWWEGRALTHVRLTFHPGYRLTTRY